MNIHFGFLLPETSWLWPGTLAGKARLWHPTHARPSHQHLRPRQGQHRRSRLPGSLLRRRERLTEEEGKAPQLSHAPATALACTGDGPTAAGRQRPPHSGAVWEVLRHTRAPRGHLHVRSTATTEDSFFFFSLGIYWPSRDKGRIKNNVCVFLRAAARCCQVMPRSGSPPPLRVCNHEPAPGPRRRRPRRAWPLPLLEYFWQKMSW